MMKTKVFERHGSWWFNWWNVDNPQFRDYDGPFKTEEEAEMAR
jgi:hypothetical protein